MRRTGREVVFALVLAGMALTSSAGEPIPGAFQVTGSVDSIDPRESSIVVGDVYMPLATSVRVRGPEGQTMLLSDIRLGMIVGLATGAQGIAASEPISEIWVLPEGYSSGSSE